MHFRLFRSSNRDKRSAGPEEHRAGYDDYGMSNDKQWARKYLLDPLTAPEPNQEWPSSLQSQTQSQWRSASSSPPPAIHDNHRRDMRNALQKVNRRLLDIKQRYRRSSSSGNTLTQIPRGYPCDYTNSNTTNTDDSYPCANTNCRNTFYRSSSHKNISNRNPSYRNVSYRNTNHRSTNSSNSGSGSGSATATGSHTSSYPRDVRYSISPSRGSSHRHSHSASQRAIRTAEFDPTNPYYRTSTSSSSTSRSSPRDSARSCSSASNYGPRRQSRQSASSSSTSSYYTRSSSYSRRRSSADTTLTSSPPSLYSGHGGSCDLGPYPAHLTNPRLQKPVQRRGSPAVRVSAAAAALSWEGRSCEQLKKARLLSMQHV
ncbi:hypothetical protein E4U16_001138 [Claviceps sp. LM84 group G4]|nr:hypothetical protein E4U16_001138 [Claviceps sp. LM84 group G4]